MEQVEEQITGLLNELRDALSARKVVRVVVLLDKSQSMSKLTDHTIENYNKFIDEQRADRTTDTEITLVLFGSPADYLVVYEQRPIDQVKALDSSVYKADGLSTALNDATYQAFSGYQTRTDRDVAYVGVVITDGQENSSRFRKKSEVTDLMDTLKKRGNFSFLFLGSHPEVWDDAKAYGYATLNSMSYSPDSTGTRRAFAGISRGLSHLKMSVSKGGPMMSESLLQEPVVESVPTPAEGAEA